MGRDWGIGFIRKHNVRTAAVFVAVLSVVLALSSPAVATHETDHRFTVEGYVCGPEGQPVSEELVVVKDTRIALREAVYTDSNGYYKALLHLHNENAGDPILVTVGEKEKKAKVEFDPEDRSTERIIQIHFGTGCIGGVGPPPWVYYGAGLAGAGIAAYAGARVIRKRRKRAQGKGKAQRKHRPT